MNDQDPNQALLQRLSRQTAICTWVSISSLAILVLMLFFPQQATWISERSLEMQKWMEPYISNGLGIVIALGAFFFIAAYVVSRIAPAAPPEIKSGNSNKS